MDWYGAEPGQGTYLGEAAGGTPLAWSTNEIGHPYWQPLNTWGPHYWIFDVNMDCTKSENGWFELKALVQVDDGPIWENDINQVFSCSGTAGGLKPYSSTNHLARCGKLNMFEFNSNACTISNL